MMVHYVGKIYNFNEPPKSEDVIVDIPFIDQNPIKDEVLIQLDKDLIKTKKSKQYKNIERIPLEEREIIKRNGISVHGQKKIIDILMSEMDAKHDRYNWTSFPNYHQLQKIIGLAWNYLLVEGETTRPMSEKMLVGFIFNYMKKNNEKELIHDRFVYLSTLTSNQKKAESDIYDEAIQFVFQTIRHWIQYKVPKWLTVINELQKYVCEKKGLEPGNYIAFANLLENGFIPDNVSILLEYSIPLSAIRKIVKRLPKDINQDDIITYIRENEIIDKSGLLQYEKLKIIENF